MVQNTLTEALVADNAPSDLTDFWRWVYGIARHKVADSYRRRGRLVALQDGDVDQSAVEASASPGELNQWIESELPKTDGAQLTLLWLLREGDGESLDEIAREAELPAPRVRQRVSRLRRHFHARWLALGAAGLALLLGTGALFYQASRPALVPPSIAREPLAPLEQARRLRENALQRCAAGAYPECIAALDQAKALDPNGEGASAIREARAAATNSEQPRRIPAPVNSPAAQAPGAGSTPSKLAPKQLAPKQLAPKQLAPKQLAPKQLAPKQLAPSKLEPKQFAPTNGLQQSEPLGAIQKNAAPSQSGLAPSNGESALKSGKPSGNKR